MYTINFSNESQNDTTFMIFQEYQSRGQEPYSLAWKTSTLAPHQQSSLRWTLDYNFVWAETGVLEPGVSFNSEQTIPASPDGANAVIFKVSEGVGDLTEVGKGIDPGQFRIGEDASIPVDRYAVGLGMDGSPAFVCQAVSDRQFDLLSEPRYFVALGRYIEGEVLDLSSIESTRITFPSIGGGSINVTLEPNGMISVK